MLTQLVVQMLGEHGATEQKNWVSHGAKPTAPLAPWLPGPLYLGIEWSYD